jgi:hypothetical protein
MSFIYRIGSAFGLACVLSGAAANAQVPATAAGTQSGGAASTAPSGGNSLSDLTDAVDANGASTQPAITKVPAPPTSRMSSFNRVTTTRRFTVPAAGQAARLARSGGASGGAIAAARDHALNPINPASSSPRRSAASSPEVPVGSTWRQAPDRPTRPPATAVRSSTHNYFPGLRSGQHTNSNTAQVTHGGRIRIPGQAGVGGLTAGRSAAGNRAGQGTAAGRIPPASSAARPHR